MVFRYDVALKAIFILSIFISPAAFAGFDVYARGGAIYKADMVDNRLMLMGRDGKKTPAPDGLYMTAEGKKYKVENGVTNLITAKSKTAASEQNAEKPAEPQKDTASKSAAATKPVANKQPTKQPANKVTMSESKKTAPQPADPVHKEKEIVPGTLK